MSGKRRILTLKEKIDIVEFHNREKPSVRSLSKLFKIGKTQAADIVKNRGDLLTKWHFNENISSKRRFLKPMGLKIDEFCYDWFIEARNKGISVSGPLIQAKAKEIADSLGYENFAASSGWLQKFRNRHNIAFKTVPEDAGSENLVYVESFLNKLPSLLKDYSPKNIFNADESVLFFRTLPNNTLTLKSEKCIDGEVSKERLTILHCVNMAGEKEKLLVIGKSQNPRAFKNIDVNKLPVVWKSNNKVSMTSAIMEEWLKEFDRRMGEENRKILLFLDNACCHPKDVRLANIQLAFLSPNCTSVVQPLEQGIIKNFKTFYRSTLVKNLILKIETLTNVALINVLDAVYYINSAWQKVTGKMIKDCFRKAGITVKYGKTADSGDFSAEDNLSLSTVREIKNNSKALGVSKSDVDEYITIDDNLLSEDISEPIPIDFVETTLISDEVDKENEVSDQAKVTNYQQAISMVEDLQKFAKNKGDFTGMELLSNIKLHFQNTIVKTQTC